MIIKRCSVLLTPLLLTACVTTGPTVGVGGFPTVSEREAQALIDSLSVVTDEQKEIFVNSFMEYSGHLDYIDYEWIQPVNKKEECKILTMQPKGSDEFWWNEGKSKNQFWDGDCKDGYAFGLGREFAYLPDGSLGSWLVTFTEPNKPPILHLTVNYENNFIQWRSNDDSYISQLTIQLFNTGPLTKELRQIHFFADKDNYKYYYEDTQIGNDVVIASEVHSNNQYWDIKHTINPMLWSVPTSIGPSDNSRKEIGVWIGSDHRLGPMAVDFRNQNNPQRVYIPENYYNHLMNIYNRISNARNKRNNMLQNSFSAVTRYQNRICRGNVSVDWMDDEIYGRICLPDGELSPFSDLIAEKQQQQKERLELAQQQFAELQRQWAEEDRKNELLALERQRLAQQQAAANSAATAQFLQQFSQSMQQFNQGAANTLRQSSNPIQVPQVNFGIQNNSSVINCIRTSGYTVHCR